METTHQVNRLLHDEHVHVQRLLDRLGNILRHDQVGRLATSEPEATSLLVELAGVLEHGLERHFRFEEEDLFPRLEAQGEGDMTALLREDHALLLPLAAELLVYLRRALTGTLTKADWHECRRLGLEFVERQNDHIEKEEMALLPALREVLDEGDDEAISAAYQAT